LDNVELHNLYSSPNVIKSDPLKEDETGRGRAGDMSGDKNEGFQGGCMRKTPLERCGNRWKSFMGGGELV